MMREPGSKPRHQVPAPQANGVAARLSPPWVVVLRPVAPPAKGMTTFQAELRSWWGKLEQNLDRQRVGKATPGKFCARSLQARRARSDAPYQRWARDREPFNLNPS